MTPGAGRAASEPAGAGDDGPLDELGYADAVEELEAILGEIEGDDVDIDVLGPKVRRAADLLRVCRDHLGAAKVDVEKIIADLEDLGDRPG